MLNKYPVKEIWDFLSKQEKITICTHINPDGDTIGSSVALRELLLNNTNVKEVKISGGDIPKQFDFISKDISDNVSDEFFNSSQVVVVDTSNKLRVWDKRVITKDSIKIDHHKEQEEWKMSIGGDHWPACGEVIGQMAEMLNLKITEKAKAGITTAIVTDTENFTQRNISSNTFKVMSYVLQNDFNYLETIKDLLPTADNAKLINKFLGQVKYEKGLTLLHTDEEIPQDIYRQLVGTISSIKDNEVTLVIGKEPNTDYYRCGLRSKGNKDISKIAEKLGGGGHHASAGFKVDKNTDISKLIMTVKNML